jgi:hypothetical protein
MFPHLLHRSQASDASHSTSAEDRYIQPKIGAVCTDKKEERKFSSYQEIQKGAVAKSYMTNGLLIYPVHG